MGAVPVLGEDDVLELRSDAVNDGDHGIAVRHGQSAAGAEIVLHVDDEEDVLRSKVHADRMSAEDLILVLLDQILV